MVDVVVFDADDGVDVFDVVTPDVTFVVDAVVLPVLTLVDDGVDETVDAVFVDMELDTDVLAVVAPVGVLELCTT